MKKILIALLSVLVLAACSGDSFEGQTADESIINLQLDFITELSNLQVYEISDTEAFGVFKAVISDDPEVFVAYTVLEDGVWRVQESLAVGYDFKDGAEPAEGSLIDADMIKRTNDETKVQEVDGKYIFNLPNSEKAVQVSLK